jgi:hypothetical protein
MGQSFPWEANTHSSTRLSLKTENITASQQPADGKIKAIRVTGRDSS